MSTIRKEVSTFSSSAERLLSEFITLPLTEDEQALIMYYVDQLARRFDAQPLALGPPMNNSR
jgi:hypothetical protein